MRKRLLLCLAFGAVGLAVGPSVGELVGISGVPALLGCAAGGCVIGYVVSIFLDVFVANAGASEIEH